MNLIFAIYAMYTIMSDAGRDMIISEMPDPGGKTMHFTLFKNGVTCTHMNMDIFGEKVYNIEWYVYTDTDSPWHNIISAIVPVINGEPWRVLQRKYREFGPGLQGFALIYNRIYIIEYFSFLYNSRPRLIIPFMGRILAS